MEPAVGGRRFGVGSTAAEGAVAAVDGEGRRRLNIQIGRGSITPRTVPIV